MVAMTAVPACTIIPFILFLTQFKNISEITSYIIIYAGLGVIILFTLYILFKHAMVPVTLTVSSDALEIIFARRSLFNWTGRKYILLRDLEFVSDDVDENHSGRKFFTLKIKDEPGKIILIAPKKTPAEEMEAFSSELSDAIEQFNNYNNNVQKPI